MKENNKRKHVNLWKKENEGKKSTKEENDYFFTCLQTLTYILFWGWCK